MSADRCAAAPAAATWWSLERLAAPEHIAAEDAEEPIAEAQPPEAVEEAGADTVAAVEVEAAARAAAVHKLLELLADTPVEAIAAAIRAEAGMEEVAAEQAIPVAQGVAVAMPAAAVAVAETNPGAEAAPLTLLLPSPARRSTDILSSTAEHLSRIAGIPN